MTDLKERYEEAKESRNRAGRELRKHPKSQEKKEQYDEANEEYHDLGEKLRGSKTSRRYDPWE